jgi:ribose-phosphate pyrophosphokinase
MDAPYNRNGGLTLVAVPGFEEVARNLKVLIEQMGNREGHSSTPVDIVFPRFGEFPSGERSVHLTDASINGHDCVIVGSGPGTDPMLMRLNWTMSHVAGRHAGRISVVTGYFPHARSDVDERDDVLAKTKMVFTMVESLSGSRSIQCWVCLDPHARQISDLGEPGQVTPIYFTNRLLRFCLDQLTKSNSGRQVVLAFPDDSSHRRFEPAITSVAKDLDREFVCISARKRRDRFGKSKIVGLNGDIDLVKGADVLMFDDEIDTGGSVISFAEMLRSFGADTIWACATHAVMSSNAADRFKKAHEEGLVSRLILSDTIPIVGRPDLESLVSSGILTVLSCMEDLAWVIYRIHWDMSIRQMR